MIVPDRPALDRIRVLRSKNAGPFAWTFDVVFREHGDFIKATRALTPAAVARVYAVPVADVLSTNTIESLNAIKVSLRRPRPAGHPGDSDCYGMNQEEPLARFLCDLLVGQGQ